MIGRVSARLMLLVAALSLGVFGCSEEVEGPSPGVPGDSAEAEAFEPGFVCNEQVDVEAGEGWVTISGSEFSPLVVDALDSSSVEYPEVTLTLAATIEGDELDETFETTLVADDSDATQIRWIDSETLQFRVTDDLELPQGSYDVTITNPNEQSATAEAAFGVLPRPSVTGVVPDMACVAQGERQVEVVGDHFLIDGGEQPTVQIGEETYEVEQAEDCRALNETAFGTAEVCRSLTVSVQEGDFDPGTEQVVVHNIEPADCSSNGDDDGVELLVVGPPSVDELSPEPICSAQLDYADMSVTGENFITVTDGDGNTTFPTVTVAGTPYTATAASGCEDIAGLTNQTAQRCTELTFEIGADDHQEAVGDGERAADLDVSVANPQPAGCSSTEEVALTVAPPPSVADAQPEPTCVADQERQVTVSGFGFLDIDGALPQVQIGPNTYDADALAECETVTGFTGDFDSCDELTVTIPEADVDADMNHAITVVNPERAACQSTETVEYYVADRPTVNRINPQPICTADGDNVVFVQGENFLEIEHEDDQGNTVNALPMVNIGGMIYDAVSIGDCVDAPLQDDGMQRPTRICTTLEVVIGQDDFAAGDYDVTVTNPLEADCTSDVGDQLNVVPPPTLSSITEQIACVEQGADSFVVDGQDFLVIDGMQPTVEIAGNSYEATADAATCDSATVDGRPVETCTSLSFTVPEGDLAPAVHQVSVVNPDSASCTSTNTLPLTIHPAPSVTGVQPNPICSEAGGTVEVTGTDLLVYGTDTPTITIDGTTHNAIVDTAADCVELTSVTSAATYSCTRLTVAVDAADLSAGALFVEATNPDPVGCSSAGTTELVSIAEPTVDSVTESIACTEGTGTLTLTGSNFAKTPSDLPTVTVGGQAVTTLSASGCSAAGTTTIESCTGLEIDATGVTFTEGVQDIIVTNPGGAGCASDGTTGVETFAATNVTNVSPSLYCDQTGGNALSVEGTNIFIVDGTNPTVDIGGTTFAADIDSANCAPVNSRIESCTSLTVNVGEADLNPSAYNLTVTNAGPLDCIGGDSATLLEAGAPTIASAQPDAVCDNDTTFPNDGTVALTGDNFLLIDTSQPTVTVNGQAATVDAMANCTTIPNPDYTVESCTDMTITVPASERDVDMAIEVQNASPASCGVPASYTVTIEPSPEVTSVTPLRICRLGGSFQIDGNNFDPNMTVELGFATADTVVVNAAGTSATATFNDPPGPGDYDLTVTNPSSCQDTHQQQVTVVGGPQVFYVDPPVAYNGINTQVTIYMSGLEGGSVADVTIIDSQGTPTSLDINFDPNKPNTVQATIPVGILASGVTEDIFDITVTDDVNCSGTSSDLLTVTDELTVAVDSIDPPFGWTGSSTGVTLTSPDPAPSGTTNFVSTPRAYLNPVDAGASTLATELSAVQFVDEFELSAIVPTGMQDGEYDIIVVNPDGTVGLLTDPNNDPAVGAFEITLEPPPLIDSVSPGSWSNQETALAVTVEGENFRQPAVEVFCSDDAGNIKSPNSITVLTSTATTIDLSVDSSNLDHLTSCYMVVTNTDNGTYAEYSPITVTNPAGNFVGFNPAPDMNIPRRDPAMSSGVPTRRAQFIYAIGGDDGANANPMRSMEAAQLDRFGQPRSWQVLPQPYNLAVPQNELPDDLTHAEATRIEDFIYLVGGYDGTNGVTGTVLRGNVLDPLDVPNITNVELSFAEGTPGNDPGTYYYRVSAVLDTNAEHNPGGETLASEPQPISIPLRILQVDITWPSFPNAVKYRVYRTDQPNQSVGTEELLAEVPAPSGGGPVTYSDAGFDSVTAGASPLPLGSVGVWHQPNDTNGAPLALNQARYHHGVASAPDPDDAGGHFVYATAGGNGATVFGDYEYFSVTVNGPRDQTVSAVTQDATNVLTTPRWRNPAVTGTPMNSNLTDSYVYVLGGEDTNGTITRRNDAALVNADGTLGTWQPVANNQRDRFEYGAAVANNAVVTAGGGNNQTDENADSTKICDLTSTCDPPNFQGWNSLSRVDLRSRAQPGYTSFNGFFYMAGGYSFDTGTTLQTTDYSVLGGSP